MNQKVIATALFAVLAGLATAMAQSPAPSNASAATPAAKSQRETKGSIRPARGSATDADARLCSSSPPTRKSSCAPRSTGPTGAARRHVTPAVTDPGRLRPGTWTRRSDSVPGSSRGAPATLRSPRAGILAAPTTINQEVVQDRLDLGRIVPGARDNIGNARNCLSNATGRTSAGNIAIHLIVTGSASSSGWRRRRPLKSRGVEVCMTSC